MNDDLNDDFIIYDLIVGADEVKCPYCGDLVTCSLLENKAKCSQCRREFQKN